LTKIIFYDKLEFPPIFLTEKDGIIKADALAGTYILYFVHQLMGIVNAINRPVSFEWGKTIVVNPGDDPLEIVKQALQ